MQLGVFLKRFRNETSISGNGLARRIGVRRHSLEKWENTGSFPNYQSSVKILNYFGIESLFEISEETLRSCIDRELNHSVGKLIIERDINEDTNFDKHVSEHLGALNLRVIKLEKTIKAQEKQISYLEKLIQKVLNSD